MTSQCIINTMVVFRERSIFAYGPADATATHYLHYIHLTAFFQDNLGKPAQERQNHYGKTNLNLLEQETVSSSGINWAICKSAPRLRQITMPAPHHSVCYRSDALPAAQPTASKHLRQLSLTPVNPGWFYLSVTGSPG